MLDLTHYKKTEVPVYRNIELTEKVGGLEKTHRMLLMQKYYKDSVNEKNIDRRINQKAERYAKKR